MISRREISRKDDFRRSSETERGVQRGVQSGKFRKTEPPSPTRLGRLRARSGYIGPKGPFGYPGFRHTKLRILAGLTADTGLRTQFFNCRAPFSSFQSLFSAFRSPFSCFGCQLSPVFFLPAQFCCFRDSEAAIFIAFTIDVSSATFCPARSKAVP